MLRKCLLLLIVVGGIGCRNPAGSSPTPAPNTTPGPYTISGRVTDYDTGAPMSGMKVNLGTQAPTTNADGVYQAVLSRGIYYALASDNRQLGKIIVASPATSGDLMVYSSGGLCASRYGTVTDASTGSPIAGASVGFVKSDSKGYWRQDYGCRDCFPCNTAILTASAEGYVDYQAILGRGVRDVVRMDIELQRKSRFRVERLHDLLLRANEVAALAAKSHSVVDRGTRANESGALTPSTGIATILKTIVRKRHTFSPSFATSLKTRRQLIPLPVRKLNSGSLPNTRCPTSSDSVWRPLRIVSWWHR